MASSVIQPQERAAATGFLDFVNASPSPFHAVVACKSALLKAGFVQLTETDDWKVQPKGKYFLTRNESSIIAFAVGGAFAPGNGFSIVAAHTDSPCPKVKPISNRSSAGYLQVGVEMYGGGLWNTWFDRDLSVAGRVVVANGKGGFESRLVRVNRPIMRIPHLAIHLYREIREKGFKPNSETHVVPVIATQIKAALSEPEGKAGAGEPPTKRAKTSRSVSSAEYSASGRHHSILMRVLAEELKVSVDAIKDFELCLYDTQPSAIGGALDEFIFSPRLDNLMMTYCGLQSLLASLQDGSLASEPNVRLFASFDNEEIGSRSDRGAASNLLLQVIQRVHGAHRLPISLRKSYLISADMAHAVHPNYAEKHETLHRVAMHKGLVIKHNANQRYATTGITAFILRHLAEKHGIPVQDFCVRQDMGCGSTIGPIISTECGMRTVDVGAPQLSMHSVREMCGTEDVSHSIGLFTAFYKEFTAIDAQVKSD